MDVLDLCADILKAMAQPTRLRIIELLQDGEHCVCEIFRPSVMSSPTPRATFR